jgi:hypothetical protein
MGSGSSKNENKQQTNNFVDFAPAIQRIKEKPTVPIMFKWVYGGRKVSILGSFNNW